MTVFSVPDLKPYHFLCNSRYITIHWQNLETGAGGDVDLRYWEGLKASDPTYARTLPASAVAETGTGPIVATVTHHNTQYQSLLPPLLAGHWAFWV